MKNVYADHLERKVADILTRHKINFQHESQPPFGDGKEPRLDFYLPDWDVYIEVKQYYSDRIAKQCSLHDNVIVLQGKKSIDFFEQIKNNKQ